MMDARAIIREGVERWNEHDRDGFLALYDERITFVDEPTGLRVTGREEFGRVFYDLWTDAYPDNELRELVVFGDGELVCLQARFAGTHTGVFRAGGVELPPTGRAIDAPFAFIAEVRDGRVTRGWHYYDRLLAFEQEGTISVEKLVAELRAA